MFRKPPLPPGPRSLLSIREIRALRHGILDFFQLLAREYGDISCFRIGPQLIYVVCHPDIIQDTLVKHHASLRKTWILGNVEDGLGKGMLTSTGDFHRRQRKLVQPALHKQRVAGYAKTMIGIADCVANGLRDTAPVDMHEEMRRLTLSVVAQTLLGSDLAEEAEELGAAITQLTEMYARVTTPLGPLLNRLPFLARNRRFEQAKKRVDDTIYRLIAQRRGTGEEREDLLAMLLNARDDDGTSMGDSLVRDEMVSIFLAGHETTAIALTWSWYLLSQHPEVEAEFHHELATVLGGRLPQPEDVERLTFTRNVVTESIRLYPPIYVIPRRALEPCPLGAYTVRPGALILVNVYSAHHDARYYVEPERFDPHRWTREMKEQLPRYAYCAFGGGPHACMGEGFAWTEAVLVMAILGQRWKARVAPGHVITMNPLVNLRPKNGMPMVLTRR